MIIAINLISKVLILMVICFCLFELITMGAFILLSQIPLMKNIPNIESVSQDNAKEIATSFSQLITTTFSNIRTDLLLFVKHIDLYHENEYFPYLNQTSEFIQSFNSCLEYSDSTSSSQSSYLDILNKIDFVNLDTETIIYKLLDSDEFNQDVSKAYYYTNPDSGPITDKERKEKFICYSLSFLKSIFIRNAIMAQKNQIMLNFTMLIHDDIVFYPRSSLNFDQIKSLPHYNTADLYCNYKYKHNCLSDTYLDEKYSDNEIYSFSPIIKDNIMVTNFCIKFQGIDANLRHLLCTTVNITQIISNIKIQSDNVVLNLVKRNKTNGLELLYSLDMNMNDVYEVFNKQAFGIYQLRSSEYKLTLFHSLYYKLMKIASVSDEDVNDIIKEYSSNIEKVTESINKYLEGNDTKEHQYIQIMQTCLHYAKENNYQPDLYNYYITNIVAKNTHFNETNKVFDSSIESTYMYLIIVIKIGNSVYSNNVYLLLVFRAIKSILYSLSEIFVGSMIVFVLFQYLITVLLYPLHTFKSIIYSIVDRKKEIERAKAGILINEDRVKMKIPFDETSIKDEYTSKEIQSIGKLIIFLNQIINLKDSKTTNIQRAKLYLNISEYIPKEKIEKLKSKIIVAKYYIKEQDSDSNINEANNERDYHKAIDLLESIQKPFEEKENELISQNDDIEQKSTALSQTKGIYINDYNYQKIFPNDPWISLQFMKQHHHLVLGQAYYYAFIDLNEKEKSKDESLKHFYHDRHENEKAFFLSQAIDNFKKASRINDHLQINNIKNIIIFLYLSNCHYYYQNENQKTEASKMLKKAMVAFARFFKMLKELTEETKTPKFYVDSRIILMISGILMEDILYSIGHFAKKLNKHRTAFEFLTKIFSISYYKNHHIHQKSIHILKKILQMSNLNKNIAYKKLNKLEMRLSLIPKKKVLFIIISEHFTENYHSLESFRLLIKNCLMKYLNNKDLIGFVYLLKKPKNKGSKNDNINDDKGLSIVLLEKLDAIKEIDYHISLLSLKKANSSNSNSNNNSNHSNKSRIYLGDAFEKISAVCKEKKLHDIDLYCFAFAKIKDICFSTDIKAKRIFEDLYYKNASIYVYCFDKQIPEDKIAHYKKFINHFSEGVIVLVKNFKMIKVGFENIANLKKQNNLLSIDYSNTENLLY